MIPQFPLFEQLYIQSSEESISENQQIDLCKQIKGLDDEGHEILFLLIVCYYRIIEKGTDGNIPYFPKIGKLGYRFELQHFPTHLIGMIYKFIPLHHKKMEDEKNRWMDLQT